MLCGSRLMCEAWAAKGSQMIDSDLTSTILVITVVDVYECLLEVHARHAQAV